MPSFSVSCPSLSFNLVKVRSFTPRVKRPEPNEYERLRLSYSLSKEGFFDEAIVELLTVLPQKPKSIYIHLALGNIYLLQKRYKEALFHFEQLNEIDPLMALGPTKIGNAYLKQGRISQAFEQFNLARNLDPKFTSAWMGLGQSYMSQSKFEEAVACFHQVLELDPESVLVYILLSDIYERQKNLELAASQSERAVQLKPRLLLGYTSLGWIYLKQKKYEASKAAFQKALELNPLSIDAKMGVAETLIATNHLKEAIKISEEIAQIGQAVSPKAVMSTIDCLGDSTYHQPQRFDETSHLDLWLYSLALMEQEQYLSD